MKFAAQSGGHGSTTTFNIGPEDIIINLRRMNSVNVDLEKGTATVGGGTIIEEMIAEAHKQKAQVGESNFVSFYQSLWRKSVTEIPIQLLEFAIALVFSVQLWEVVSVGAKACMVSELITCFLHVLLLQMAKLSLFLLPKIPTFGGVCVVLVIILGLSRV